MTERSGGIVDLRGRTALVTGGSRGVGAATARLLARAGAEVAIGYHSRRGAAEAVVAELEASGVRARAYGHDVATAEGARALFAAFDADFGRLDIFVASAGVWPPDGVAVADMDDAQWRTTLATNLDSVFFTCREAARRIHVDGRIVLVGSTAGQRGEAFHADYAASKGAMISFVKGFCVELAPRGVTVNCVAPGWIDTDMAAPALAGSRAEIEESIPLGRVASAEDIAGPIVFLCSPLARHVTGEILNVNGGAVLVG